MNITVPIPSALPGYSQHHPIPPAEPITLNVSGQAFTTTIPTLTSRSHYFQSLFHNGSDWKSHLSPSNTLFIDSSPSTFPHILAYLRRGVFPLSHSTKTGHNYALYASLLADAQFFQIPKLTHWLANHLYLNCLTISTVWSSSFKDDQVMKGGQFQKTSTWGSNVISTQLVKDQGATTQVHVCGHQTSERHTCTRKMCGSPTSLKDEMERFRWAEVGREVAFCYGWCSDTGKEFMAYWDARNAGLGVPGKS